MSFVGQAFNSPNGDVRNAAVKVTTEVYRLMGAPIEKYLKNVKPVVREVCLFVVLQPKIIFTLITESSSSHQMNSISLHFSKDVCTTYLVERATQKLCKVAA